MIEIEEAKYAISVAREYADEKRYDACVEVLEKLLGTFPQHYRFGRHVALALGAPDWDVDWRGVEDEIVLAINAQIIAEMHRRDKVTADNRAKARKPRTSKYAWMQEIAKELFNSKPHTSDNQLAILVLDRIQTETENADDLPSDRTVRGWIKKLRTA